MCESPKLRTTSGILSVVPSSEAMTSSPAESCGRMEDNCSCMNLSPLYVAMQTVIIYHCFFAGGYLNRPVWVDIFRAIVSSWLGSVVALYLILIRVGHHQYYHSCG